MDGFDMLWYGMVWYGYILTLKVKEGGGGIK